MTCKKSYISWVKMVYDTCVHHEHFSQKQNKTNTQDTYGGDVSHISSAINKVREVSLKNPDIGIKSRKNMSRQVSGMSDWHA